MNANNALISLISPAMPQMMQKPQGSAGNGLVTSAAAFTTLLNDKMSAQTQPGTLLPTPIMQNLPANIAATDLTPAQDVPLIFVAQNPIGEIGPVPQVSNQPTPVMINMNGVSLTGDQAQALNTIVTDTPKLGDLKALLANLLGADENGNITLPNGESVTVDALAQEIIAFQKAKPADMKPADFPILSSLTATDGATNAAGASKIESALLAIMRDQQKPAQTASDDKINDDALIQTMIKPEQQSQNTASATDTTRSKPSAQHNAAAQTQAAAQQQQPAANTAPQSQNGAKQQPATNMAMINEMGAQNGGGETGFGAHSGAGQTHTTTGVEFVKSVDSLQSQSFNTYMMQAKPGATHAAPMTQTIAMQLSRGVAGKFDTISVQLTPVELGTIEAKIKIQKDGTLRAHLVADNAETLAALQRDKAELAEQMRAAGVEIEDGAISFDLRENNHHASFGYDQEMRDALYGTGTQRASNTEENALIAHAMIEAQGYVTATGVNIMV